MWVVRLLGIGALVVAVVVGLNLISPASTRVRRTLRLSRRPGCYLWSLTCSWMSA